MADIVKFDENNVERWVANQQAQRGIISLKGNTEALQKRIDAIQNRDYGKAAKEAVVLGVMAGWGLAGIRPPEFNLLEQAAAYDAEPLFRRAVSRQLNLWFKQGFQLIGPNAKYNEYIEKRLRQIAFVSKMPTRELFRRTVRSLLKYSNAFWIIVRDNKLSGGMKKSGMPEPIAGVFPVSSLTMFPRYEKGQLAQWVRVLNDGRHWQVYDVQDVIHFTFDQEEDFIFGKPRMLGTINDIAAMRRMEENVEILVAKYLFPIYQLIVGTEERPCQYFPNGTSELDASKGILQDMEQEGMLITSERHKLEVISALDKTVDAIQYLGYFKQRVLNGMGMSEIDLGEGSNSRGNIGDNISQILKDGVVDDQGSFADQIAMKFFIQLFLEHPDDISALNAFDQVRLSFFFNVDLDNRMKYENHIINLWNNNILTEDEARAELGKQPFSMTDRKRTHFNLLEIPLAVISARDEQWTGKIGPNAVEATHLATGTKPLPPGGNGPQATGTGAGLGNRQASTGKTKKRKKKPAAAAVATKAQPTNQHGTNLGPTKARSSFAQREQELLGNKLLTLVDRLMFCDDYEEAKSIVQDRFTQANDQEYILPIVKMAYTGQKINGELRANLVVGLLSVVDRFRDEEE